MMNVLQKQAKCLLDFGDSRGDIEINQ